MYLKFCHFQPSVAYDSVAYIKKRVYSKTPLRRFSIAAFLFKPSHLISPVVIVHIHEWYLENYARKTCPVRGFLIHVPRYSTTRERKNEPQKVPNYLTFLTACDVIFIHLLSRKGRKSARTLGILGSGSNFQDDLKTL